MSQEKRKALGRGLDALLPRRPSAVVEPVGGTLQVKRPPDGKTGAGGAVQVVSDPAPAPAFSSTNAFTVAGPPAPAGNKWSAEFIAQSQIRPGEMVIEVPLELIGRNPYQTRVTNPDDLGLEELALSIKEHGVMQPVVIRPRKEPGPKGELYDLIAGERRWLASSKAGKTHLPAIVRDVANDQVLVLTIIENLHRQDLNPIQHARAFDRLAQEFRLTQEEVAIRTGLSRPAVANYLRLLKLSDELQKAVADGELGFGQAKVILSLSDPTQRDLLGRKVISGKLTVRDTEALLEDFLRPRAEEKNAPVRTIDPNVHAAEIDLQRALGCRVEIRDRNGRGKIMIEYKSLEDFDRVVEALK